MGSRLHVRIVTPTVPHVQTGNVLTAVRYARILRGLGHRVNVDSAYEGAACDVLICLHARRSAPSVRDFAERHPDRPLILVLTGTDLYQDIKSDAEAQHSMELATRMVVLQRMGVLELPTDLRSKAWVIYQSSPPYAGRRALPRNYFRVCVIGHLRPEKDPLRTAWASRGLPASSRIRVVQIGGVLSPELGEEAQKEQEANPRYRWLGPLPHWRTRQLLASSHIVAITSLMEGSSNVLCEALTSPTPVVASRISGLIGTLGEEYPGYFPVGNTQALTQLLARVESDPHFYDRLATAGLEVAPLVAPESERACWEDLLSDVTEAS